MLAIRRCISDGEPTGLTVSGYREVWRKGISGRFCRVWEKLMSRIYDEVLECSIFLYASEEDAVAGENYGGSGFLVGWPFVSDSTLLHPYAVTNSHVIDDGFTVPRMNDSLSLKAGEPLPLTQGNWIHHPDGDDIAIAPLDLDPATYQIRLLRPERSFLTKEIQKKIQLGAGDDAFMVGRFLNKDEKQSNNPVVRFGHLAATKEELIDQGAERNHFMQESFLVEVHSYSGFSGSPVFIRFSHDRVRPHSGGSDRGLYQAVARTADPEELFLGVDWGHISDGMAGVIPAWRLAKFLEWDVIRNMRKQREDEQKKKRHSGPVLDSGNSNQKSRQGISIPIPTRGQFERDLAKATRKRDKE
jgi:hypothetical protein